MTRILFYLDEPGVELWQAAFEAAIPDVDLKVYPDWGSPDDGPAYAFAWEPEAGLIAKYPNIQTVFSLGAGVDHLTRDPSLPIDLPIIRMSDDGLKEGMAEFVLMSVLMHHRYMPRMLRAQREHQWRRLFPARAKDVRVGILGYGALGIACAAALKPLGYQVATWSRTEKQPENGIEHFSGKTQFNAFLARTDILVGLLPSTPETTGLLNKETMSLMPKHASIVNVGRGTLINLDDLVELLDQGHISGATLDVFAKEPLDDDDPLWDHPRIHITPHIASITRPETAAEYVARNIKKIENGQSAENTLDRKRGY